MTDLDTVQYRTEIEYTMYLGSSEHDNKHVALRFSVGIWRLSDFEDWAQSLDVRCQKCSDLR